MEKRCVDALTGDLAAASSWRKTELTKLAGKFDFQYRKMSQRDPANPAKTVDRYQYIKGAIIGDRAKISALDKRAIYLLTYSHWEGYVKQAIQIYLSSLAYVTFDEVEFHPKVVKRIVLARLEEHRDQVEKKVDLSADLLRGLGHTLLDGRDGGMLEIRGGEKRSLSNTGSNLRFDVLKKLLTKLDLETPEFFYRNKEIIDCMVDIRNGIAHGDAGFRRGDLPGELPDGLPKTIEFVKESFLELQQALIEKAEVTFQSKGGVTW